MNSSPENNPFAPNTVIELSHVNELHPFEDTVAEFLSDGMTPGARQFWGGRERLQDILRPEGFNGTIADIELKVMDNASERIETARGRGFGFGKGIAGSKARERFAVFEAMEKALGFAYTANAMSSGRWSPGQVRAELWYLPGIKSGVGESGIQRIATKPKKETENFDLLQDTSRRIGLVVLSHAVRTARPQGFRN